MHKRKVGVSLCAAVAALLLSAPAKAAISVSLTPSVSSPAPVGTLITWTAAASGTPAGPYWYRFIVRGFDQERRIVKDFGPDNAFQWSPVEREGFYIIEVAVRHHATGEMREAVAPFHVTSNAADGKPVVRPTKHPLVFLYSAPPCAVGAIMTVYFLDPATGILQSAPPKRCDGVFSANFYIAGLRGSTFYYVKHLVFDRGDWSEGPVMDFTSGAVPQGLPQVSTSSAPDGASSQPVLLASSLFAPFIATDLSGNLIWYYPDPILFLTRPEPGGYFFGIHEDHEGDQSKQIMREFDLAGVTTLETNAARVNEQLSALGRRRIGGFHHEARRLSDGRILVLATVEEIMTDVQGPGPVNVVGDMIIVLNRDLEVVWTWDAFDHLDVRRKATQEELCNRDACPPLFLAETGADWVHGNSVAETPDGNLLYSARNQDWVIKIAYENGFGNGGVLWRLGAEGDFKIASDDPNPWFSHQHDAEFESNGSMSIFDNGNIRRDKDPNARSRGQVLRLDEKNRTAELVLNADLGYYSFALGSAQKLDDGNYFFCVGFRSDGTGLSVAVDSGGTPVFAIQSTAPEYRTFRMKNLYTP